MIAPLVVFAASTAPIIGIIRRWQKTNLTHATAGASHMTYRRTRIINLYWQHHASGPIKVRRSICAMVHQDQPKTHARSTSAKDAQSHCPLPRENADRPSRTVMPRPASEGLHHSGHWPRIQSLRVSFPEVGIGKVAQQFDRAKPSAAGAPGVQRSQVASKYLAGHNYAKISGEKYAHGRIKNSGRPF
jgi:hypothetical protein